jgi:hypothetical protein
MTEPTTVLLDRDLLVSESRQQLDIWMNQRRFKEGIGY